ncbi:MAG: hypothetical protein LQ346_008458 [Caloplaca aetnensis]|nr:MAG: hypothetical protein LQ346_008458 [Caloplaca aetnensis]
MFINRPEQPSVSDHGPSAGDALAPLAVVASAAEEDSQEQQRPISESAGPQPAAIDFAQVAVEDEGVVGASEKGNKRATFVPPPDEPVNDSPRSSNRASVIFNRLSYVARNFVGSGDRPSMSECGKSAHQSVQSNPNRDSYDFEGHPAARRLRKRDSLAVPKSWRFLGIDGSGLGDTVSNVTNKIRKASFRDMYEKAKIKQETIQRSKTGQTIFQYTFYVLLVATVYFLLVGMPLWRGFAWYMYIVFQKHLVLKAGLTITFGIGFLYAFCPLLINFEPTAPLPEVDESGRATKLNTDTALIIPCYKSEKIVVANGNSPEPLDNTAEVCRQYDVSHTWSPLGSKIIAQFVGCYVARRFPNVLLIDDDCLLPPNLPIVSDRMRGNIKCIGYIMKSIGEGGSPGTMCQQAQDLEYKLCGLAKLFAGKIGSVTFPHGCIVLWDRELLVRTFQEHPGFSVSEDWFFGHAARQLGSRITMCTSTFVSTETPAHIFSHSGGARGGFGE